MPNSDAESAARASSDLEVDAVRWSPPPSPSAGASGVSSPGRDGREVAIRESIIASRVVETNFKHLEVEYTTLHTRVEKLETALRTISSTPSPSPPGRSETLPLSRSVSDDKAQSHHYSLPASRHGRPPSPLPPSPLPPSPASLRSRSPIPPVAPVSGLPTGISDTPTYQPAPRSQSPSRISIISSPASPTTQERPFSTPPLPTPQTPPSGGMFSRFSRFRQSTIISPPAPTRPLSQDDVSASLQTVEGKVKSNEEKLYALATTQNNMIASLVKELQSQGDQLETLKASQEGQRAETTNLQNAYLELKKAYEQLVAVARHETEMNMQLVEELEMARGENASLRAVIRKQGQDAKAWERHGSEGAKARGISNGIPKAKANGTSNGTGSGGGKATAGAEDPTAEAETNVDTNGNTNGGYADADDSWEYDEIGLDPAAPSHPALPSELFKLRRKDDPPPRLNIEPSTPIAPAAQQALVSRTS